MSTPRPNCWDVCACSRAAGLGAVFGFAFALCFQAEIPSRLFLKWPQRALAAVFLFAAVFLVSVAAQGDEAPSSAIWPGGNGTLGVHFLEVGQGDATLLVCPNDNRILVDAGSLPYPPVHRVRAIRGELLSLLAPTEKKIHTLVVTHADGDHYGLLPELLSEVAVEKVLISGHLGAYSDVSWDEHRHGGGSWLRSLQSAGKLTALPVDYHDPIEQPSAYFDCGGAQVFVVAASVRMNSVPEPHQGGSFLNGQSIVLMVRYGDFQMLLTGDATFATEYKILQWYGSIDGWLEVDVLKIAHHGSSNGSTHADFVEATKPHTAIVSAGPRNSHGHPRKSVIKSLEPHTDNSAEPHAMTWKGRSSPSSPMRWVDDADYEESLYSTNATGTISVYVNRAAWWIVE